MSKTFYKIILFHSIFSLNAGEKMQLLHQTIKLSINKCFVTNNIEHHCDEYLIIFSIPQISIPDEKLSISETIVCVLGEKRRQSASILKSQLNTMLSEIQINRLRLT